MSSLIYKVEKMQVFIATDTLATMMRLAARRCWFVPRTLTAAPVEKRVEEPERRVGPRGCERLVLLFPRVRQDTVSLLPCADGLQGRLPPPRPRATPAHDISSGLVANID
jgi:hypothetical protein